MKAARPTHGHFLAEQACKVFDFVSAVVDLLLLLKVHRHSRANMQNRTRCAGLCVCIYIQRNMYSKEIIVFRNNH